MSRKSDVEGGDEEEENGCRRECRERGQDEKDIGGGGRVKGTLRKGAG